ncbi:hypothetical protein GYMLUDRAFT_251069 [Collybiopsis luxurians FD-317 M1]|uniref:Uncharacterized protein n=1 Tax=Collybiopsis luxurians FD-317 M1 TaxID=944289 RepID=A0A0D0CCF9_9AGAR|nr:hypothetical protein GYMLUDRAFT_251069 [Collybiopsis luxurians FD-317 M1]
MKQLNLVLNHPSSSSSPSASTLQAKIEHLKSKLAAEQTEKDSLKQNISNYKSKLAELKVLVFFYPYEPSNCIMKLESKFGSQSPEPEPTVARAYTTIRSSRKVLSRVEVEGPLKEAYQKYSLKGAIEDKASEADSEVEEDTSVTPVIGRRRKKSCPARFSIKSKPSTDKGKQWAPNTTDSSDSEDVGIRSGWTAKEQVRQSNKMVRTQLHEMLNVRRSKDIVGRDGIETKDPDRLALLEKDPNKYGPKIHCSFLDTSGSTINDLMDSDWNQWFILTLGNMCKAIADASCNPDRFMKMDWQALAQDKVYQACLDVVKLKPQPGETVKQALARYMGRYCDLLERAQNTQSRHTKFDLHKKITAAMIEVCKDRNDHEGVMFWEWVLVLLDHAGHNFMLDDEDMTVLDRTDGKRTIARCIKQVALLK